MPIVIPVIREIEEDWKFKPSPGLEAGLSSMGIAHI